MKAKYNLILFYIIIVVTIVSLPFYFFGFGYLSEGGLGFLIYYYQYFIGFFIVFILLGLIIFKIYNKDKVYISSKFFFFSVIYIILFYLIGIIFFNYQVAIYQEEWNLKLAEDKRKLENKYSFELSKITQQIKYDPNNASLYYQRGMHHRFHGDFKLSIADFEKAISLDSNKYEYYFELGYSLTFIKDFDNAYKNMIKAYQLNSEKGIIKEIERIERLKNIQR